MKSIISFLFLALIIVYPFVIQAEDGFLVDYDVAGISIGNTKIKGNIRVMMKKDIKKITGNIFFQEAGQPFPDLVEKNVMIDFSKGKKSITTGDIKAGVTTDIEDDYKLIKNNEVKISAKKDADKANIVIDIKSPPEFGGEQKYIIEFEFNKSLSQQELGQMSKYPKPTATGLISFFTDNEKLIEFVNMKLGNYKYMFPSKFFIKWEQNKIVQLEVTGTLKSKVAMDLTAEDFED